MDELENNHGSLKEGGWKRRRGAKAWKEEKKPPVNPKSKRGVIAGE